jgi:hypothetical protein
MTKDNAAIIKALKQQLFQSTLAEANNAYNALIANAEIQLDAPVIQVASSGILATYTIRAERLAKQDAPHAQRLAISCNEFVNALTQQKPSQLYTLTIKPNGNGHFLVWYEPTTLTILGCAYLIANQAVPEAEWQQLWGKPSE